MASPIIEKVIKLLALSKSSNIHEANAAAAAANRLIDEYRLSEVDLKSCDVESPEEDSGYIYESGRITQYKSQLCLILATHYGCAIWNDSTHASGRQVSRYKLVGKKSDIELTKYMFSYLVSECARLSEAHAGKGRVYIASYCLGFVNGIQGQLKASRIDAQKGATSAAIMQVDARLDASKEVMYRLHSNLRKGRNTSHSQVNYGAFSQGQQKGASMHLGASSGSGTKMLNR